MNYIKKVYSRRTNPRVIAILALAGLVFILSMVDAFANDHHNDNRHTQHQSVVS